LEIKIQKTSRPFYVTLIIFGVLLLIVAPNLLRMVQTVKDWQFLTELLPISPFYLLITGVVWTITGTVIVIGLWRGGHGMRKAAIWGVIAYVIYFWLDRLFVRSSSFAGTNEPFVITASVLLVGFTIISLSRQRVKTYFGEFNEH